MPSYRTVLTFVTILLVPCLMGADDDAYALNRQKIEAMTSSERAALQYKFNAYKSLPESTRDRYRALQSGLDEDARNGGSLRQVLGNYAEWLGTLTPAQREELRQAPDNPARLTLVRRLKEEQERRAGPSEGSPLPLPPALGRLAQEGVHVRSEDVEPLLDLLASRMPIPPDQRQKLEELPPHRRHVRIVLNAVEQAEKRGKGGAWPDELLLRDLIEKLPNEPARQFFTRLPNAEAKRRLMSQYIVRGVASEWQTELDKHRPSEAELMKLSNSLDPRMQNELGNLPKREAERMLLWHFFSQQKGEFGQEFQELKRLMQQVTPRENFRPGPGGRPGEGRPPDGRPGEGRPGDNRPRPPEPPPERNGPGGRRPDGRFEDGPPGERRPEPPPPRRNEGFEDRRPGTND